MEEIETPEASTTQELFKCMDQHAHNFMPLAHNPPTVYCTRCGRSITYKQ